MRAREAATSACDSALAIAVATSSVKPASRFSVSDASSSLWVNATTMEPHTRPSTLTGTPTDVRSPQSLAAT
jgi:hypothetical protein